MKYYQLPFLWKELQKVINLRGVMHEVYRQFWHETYTMSEVTTCSTFFRRTAAL